MINLKKLIWEYNISEDEFKKILAGKKEIGWFNQGWAVKRCLEYLTYYDFIQVVSLETLHKVWPEIKFQIRVEDIRKGIDYVLQRRTLSTAG